MGNHPTHTGVTHGEHNNKVEIRRSLNGRLENYKGVTSSGGQIIKLLNAYEVISHHATVVT